MAIKKLFIILGFVVLSLKAEAQDYKLLNLTELQIREKLSKKYPVILHQDYTHESASGLIFKDKRGKVRMRCIFHFYMDKCSEVQSFEDAKNWKRIKKLFDKKFNIILENRWRNKENTFEISMFKPTTQTLFITYIRGISKF